MTKEGNDQFTEIELKRSKLEENPPARPTPSAELITAAGFEFERITSAFKAAGTDRGMATEVIKKMIESGNEAQKIAFVTYYSKIIALIEGQFPKEDHTRAFVLSTLSGLYSKIDDSLKSPKEIAHEKALKELDILESEIQKKLNTNRILLNQAGISPDGPDPWKEKALKAEYSNKTPTFPIPPYQR